MFQLTKSRKKKPSSSLVILSVVSDHMRLSRLQALVDYKVTLSHWAWTSLVAVTKLLLKPETNLNSEQIEG